MPDPTIPGFAPPRADRMTARRRRGNAPSADTAGHAIRPERLVPRETEPAHEGDRERVHIACPGAEVCSTSPLTAPGVRKSPSFQCRVSGGTTGFVRSDQRDLNPRPLVAGRNARLCMVTHGYAMKTEHRRRGNKISREPSAPKSTKPNRRQK